MTVFDIFCFLPEFIHWLYTLKHRKPFEYCTQNRHYKHFKIHLQKGKCLNPLMTIVSFLEHDLYMVNARFHVIVSSQFWSV